MKPSSLPIASPHASAEPAPPTDVHALWAHCLAIADARRADARRAAAHNTTPHNATPSSTDTQAQLQPSTLSLTPGADGWQLTGPWDAQACDLFKLLKPLLDCQPDVQPWVIAQLGQSLDGCIATRTGDSHFVNGPENLLHLHRLRALCDAVIVGAGTVIIDNPQLTTRRVPGPNPVRVLFDPQLQLARHVKATHVFNDGQAPTLWLCDARWQTEATGLAGKEQVLAVPNLLRADGTPALAPALAALHARGLKLLFVEGGGVTVSRFLAEGCLDRLHLALAPLIIGNGRPGLRFAGAEVLKDCARPSFSVYPMGPDQLWDLDLASLRAEPCQVQVQP